MQTRRIATLLCLIAGSTCYVQAQQGVTTFPLVVSFDPANPNAATYSSVAMALNGFNGLPTSRRTFWSDYTAANGYPIWGWTGFITSAQPNGNGFLVTLNVQAAIGADGGAYMIMDSPYLETYQVNNDGSFGYIQSFDPNGMAGQVSHNINVY